MASFSSSSTHHNWLLSLKVVLISTGVLFLAMVLRFSVPIVSDFIVSEVPSIWSFLLTWLRPPYLYILMNCIIISIVASSKLQHHHELDDDHSHSSNPLVIPPSPIHDPESVNISRGIPLDYVVLPPVQIPPPEPIKISGDVRTDNAVLNVAVSNGYVYDAKVSQTSNDKIANEESVNAPSSVGTNLLRKDSLGFSLPNGDEKSPVSARFGHRKAAKAMPLGGRAALGVSKPKRQDTLESTWKTITDGRAMPLTRHLKKSDTWDSHSRRNGPLTDQNGNATASPPMNPKVMKKSETFSEGSRICKENSSPSSGKLRKEPSLSQDELNRRVEAFIKKFNEEMRLQRQESLRQYKEMINRGVH